MGAKRSPDKQKGVSFVPRKGEVPAGLRYTRSLPLLIRFVFGHLRGPTMLISKRSCLQGQRSQGVKKPCNVCPDLARCSRVK